MSRKVRKYRNVTVGPAHHNYATQLSVGEKSKLKETLNKIHQSGCDHAVSGFVLVDDLGGRIRCRYDKYELIYECIDGERITLRSFSYCALANRG